MVDLLIPLALVLGFVFGWNNSSLLIGNLTSSGTLTLSEASVLSAGGILVGVLAGGSGMLKSLNGILATVPAAGLQGTLILSVVLMVILTGLALPAPLSGAMTGSFLGIAVGAGAQVSLGGTSLVFSFWFIAPILSAVAAFLLRRGASAFVPRLSLVGSDTFNRVGVIGSSLAVAYSLGANNIGLIVGTAAGSGQGAFVLLLSAGTALAAAVGVVLLGKGAVSGTIGDRLISLGPQAVISVFGASAFVVLLGTLFAVPMSMTQCILGAMIGAALSQRTVVINRRVAYESVATWVAVPLAAFALGYGLAFV